MILGGNDGFEVNPHMLCRAWSEFAAWKRTRRWHLTPLPWVMEREHRTCARRRSVELRCILHARGWCSDVALLRAQARRPPVAGLVSCTLNARC